VLGVEWDLHAEHRRSRRGTLAAMVANVRRLGEPWTFGLHPGAVGAFVARSGLRLCEDLGADDYRRRYLGAAMPGYQFYRIAVAEVG
jgi:hypothetical protein